MRSSSSTVDEPPNFLLFIFLFGDEFSGFSLEHQHPWLKISLILVFVWDENDSNVMAVCWIWVGIWSIVFFFQMKCLIWSVDFLQWSSNGDLRAIYTGFLLLLYLVNLLNIHQKTAYRSRSKCCVRASWPLVLLIRIWLTTFKSSDVSRLVDEIFVRLAQYISSWME